MNRTFGVGVLSLLLAQATWARDSDVQISHANTASGDLPGVMLRNGASFNVYIYATDITCFEYSLNGVIPEPGAQVTAEKFLKNQKTDISHTSLSTTHRERVLKYTVRAVKRASATCQGDGQNLDPKTWTIPVLALWNMSVSGAFLLDGLTDHVFSLEPGMGRLPGDNTDRQGYHIRKDDSAADEFHKGIAAMMHLYYDSGHRLDWVPFSFGFSSVNNDITFLVSPLIGLRLGTRVYVSGGAAFGQRNRLPNGLHVGDFVTDANTLNTLPRQSKMAWFAEVSISVVEIPLSKFREVLSPSQ